MSKSLTKKAIEELCKNHGIEDEGYTLEEAKDICGVAGILRVGGSVPVKEITCVDWFDGDCANKDCPDHTQGECDYGGIILEAIGGVG